LLRAYTDIEACQGNSPSKNLKNFTPTPKAPASGPEDIDESARRFNRADMTVYKSMIHYHQNQ